MADKKITALTAVANVYDNDLFPLVADMSTTPVTYHVEVADMLDGWIGSATWSYVSASTFTISGDYTAVYKIGVRLRWTQTTVKYGVVISSSYGAPNTTVTIAVNTDYVIANAAITAQAYSFLAAPLAWPGWFSFTPVIASSAGAITAYTVNSAKYSIVGKLLRDFVDVTITNNGTGSGNITQSLPFSLADGTGSGRENAIGGKMLQCDHPVGTSTLVYNYDNTYPGGANYRLRFGITGNFA